MGSLSGGNVSEFPVEFVSGFVGYTRDPKTRAVMPVMSWYLLDKTTSVTFHMVEQHLAASGRTVAESATGAEQVRSLGVGSMAMSVVWKATTSTQREGNHRVPSSQAVRREAHCQRRF